MFQKETGSEHIANSVAAMEGSFKLTPTGQTVELNITMAYVEADTGTTCGSCPIKLPMLSPNTLDAFKKFIDCVEEDFGRVVFRHGSVKAQPPRKHGLGWRTVDAERNEPPKLEES